MGWTKIEASVPKKSRFWLDPKLTIVTKRELRVLIKEMERELKRMVVGDVLAIQIVDDGILIKCFEPLIRSKMNAEF